MHVMEEGGEAKFDLHLIQVNLLEGPGLQAVPQCFRSPDSLPLSDSLLIPLANFCIEW